MEGFHIILIAPLGMMVASLLLGGGVGYLVGRRLKASWWHQLHSHEIGKLSKKVEKLGKAK